MEQPLESAHALFVLLFHAGVDWHLLLLSMASGTHPPQLEQFPDRSSICFKPLSWEADAGSLYGGVRKSVDFSAVLRMR